MQTQWVINPEVDSVNVLADLGRFLDTDYRMAIEALFIPYNFEEYTETTGRRFVIVGARSIPTATAKSVFLCLKLAGAESIVVKAPTMDEAYLTQNVFDYHNDKKVRTVVYTDSSEELEFNQEWKQELENATDIVVFGGQYTMETFRKLETVDRRVWEHGPKFSFGFVDSQHLTPVVINEICFDFFSFYGEGCLSPKFYFILGRRDEEVLKKFSVNLQFVYGEYLERFRDKLPLARKSEIVQQLINATFAYKYVRVEELNSPELFSNLYGDARLVFVDSMSEVRDFIDKWRENISTVAVNLDDDHEILDLLEDEQVTRICGIGTMQFPGFYEQFDSVDDFSIYVKDENELFGED